MSNDRSIPNNGSSDKVTFKVTIEGEEIPGNYQALSIVVLKEINRIPFAKVSILDGEASKEEFTASNEELFVPGKEIEILVGYDAQEDSVFKGIIVKHGIKIGQDGTSLLKLDCRDKIFKATLGLKSRYFVPGTDGEAIKEILSGYDVDATISDLDISHEELIQYESTDWEFMLSRAENNGTICVADDGNISIQKPNFKQDAALSLQFGATILDFDGEIDTRTQFSTVQASSWDYAAQEMIEAESTDVDGIPEPGNLAANDLADVGGADPYSLRYSNHIVQDELQAVADSEMLKSRLSKNRGRVKFTGFASLKPGNLIELNGLGDRFSGPVFVSAVRHDITGGEWHTQAQFGFTEDWLTGSDAKNAKRNRTLIPKINGLHVGIVSQLGEDPEGENRILVKLPVISADDEGTWARVATLDAGENRGSFFLPEIGDEVIVGFIGADPRDAVVLGMMNSSSKPAPLEASDDNFEKGFITKSEMKLLFNDETKTLSIETPAGKKISLDEDQGVIQFEDENGNKIVMDSSGIVIESGGELTLKAGSDLKMEGGANAEIKAGANFKAEGSAGAEVSTGAIAILKGSLVQIN